MQRRSTRTSRRVEDGPTATALIIGNELLSGKIADHNLAVLARTLRDLGITLSRALTISDDVATIASEVRSAARRSTWVFTSGGVGPTHDDLTLLGVARAFGRGLETSRELDALIRRVYGDAVQPGHLVMARVPSGAMLESTEDVPWPAVRMRNVWVLPGVPEIFEMKMRIVRARLAESARPFVSLSVVSTLDEGQLKPHLDRVVAEHPGIQVGSYPRFDDPIAKTKLTFDGRDRGRCEEARAAFVGFLPEGAVLADTGSAR